MTLASKNIARFHGLDGSSDSNRCNFALNIALALKVYFSNQNTNLTWRIRQVYQEEKKSGVEGHRLGAP